MNYVVKGLTMTKLQLERDGYTWYVIDGTGLERVADTNTVSKPHAKAILDALQTGKLPKGWSYEPATPGPGLRWAKLDSIGVRVDVWLPELTGFAQVTA